MTQGSRVARAGFTLVELLLSMAFIAVLLLAIAITVMQISSSYNRGMTVKDVNQAGRLVSEDIRYNVSSSSAFTADGDSFATDDLTGRLCLGNYSYIWNYGRAFGEGLTPISMRIDTVTTPIRLVKVIDQSRKYCQIGAEGNITHRDINPADVGSARELMGSSDRNLAIQGFTVDSPDASFDPLTGQRLHRVSFTIGSGDISSMNEDQTRCLMPGEEGADLTYCVVQKFTLVIRAGSGVN